MSSHEETQGRPASVHTEIAILGAMMLQEDAVVAATASKLQVNDFSLDSHRRIYSAMLEMVASGDGIDVYTVAEHLKRKGELNAVGDVVYLLYLTDGIPHQLNIESYVRIVKDKAFLRKIQDTLGEGADRAGSQSEEARALHAEISARLAELGDQNANDRDLLTTEEVLSAGFESVDDFMGLSGITPGVSTLFPEFDRKLGGGMKSGDLIIIAARPSMGKTAWAINIAQNASIRGGSVVAVFSMEMSRESLLKRIVASEARVSLSHLNAGATSQMDREKIMAALDRVTASELYIDDTPAQTPLEIEAKARRLKQRRSTLDLIIVDYLQLMEPGKRTQNREQEVSSISRGLKALAKRLDCPVVALSQLSRETEKRHDKRPILSDLRESGAIEQDADVVCFLHRPEYYERDNEDLRGLAEIIIAKQRNGPLGSIDCVYLPHCTTFYERGHHG